MVAIEYLDRSEPFNFEGREERSHKRLGFSDLDVTDLKTEVP